MPAVQLDVTVVNTRWDARQLDESTMQLMRDLRQVAGIAVRPLSGSAIGTGKSGTVQEIGTLAVSGLLSAAGLKAISDVIVAYLQRSGARQITVRNGEHEITVTGASAADVSSVVRDIEKLAQRSPSE